MPFDFEEFVEEVRRAAKEPEPDTAIRALLENFVADPAAIIRATPSGSAEEEMLYEDDNLSIWRCLFQPHVVMPPHEHRMTVHIAAYVGLEKNILFRREAGKLVHTGTTLVHPGEVITLDEDCIHAVTAEGDAKSLALHVYMGPLMQIKRDLFDWETGDVVAFSMENFDKLKRPAAALPAY